MKPRAVFFGSPTFAVPSLDALTELADVLAVVCQPDKPSGRGLAVAPPAVKVRAEQLGVSVVQPTKLRTGEFAAWLRSQRADVGLVAAYGRILPPDVLAAPRLGCVNVHGSLLPKYRGAAPITWAIVRGEKETGVTLMQMDAGMDTGAVLEKFPLAIGPDETSGELFERLAALGADAVRRGLPKVRAGAYVPVPQDDAESTLAPILKKEDGAIDWAKSAQEVHDHVRGMSPWPGAFTHLTDKGTGKTLKVHATKVSSFARPGAPPGDVILADKTQVVVACAAGAVELVRVQLEGRKAIRAVEWHLGRGVHEGDRLA